MSQPPLTRQFGSVGCHFSAKMRFEWPAATWLRPKQGGPALYATGRCCANRALFPCFDIPSQRFTWAASIRVKDEYHIVAAAERKGERVEGGWRVCRFEMATPVPAYLVAVAVGVLETRAVGPRSTLYAHPSTVEAAEAELRGVPEKYLTAAETMFGPYAWGRFDVVVMPRAFAHGSVAHPHLTFLAPSVIVGDGSLAYTAAGAPHVLGHPSAFLPTRVSSGVAITPPPRVETRRFTPTFSVFCKTPPLVFADRLSELPVRERPIASLFWLS